MGIPMRYLVLAALFTLALCPATRAQWPFQDASLPLEKRVDDLVSRMSLPEKIGQM